jgi:RNA recognition motif-containing protein
MSREPGRSRGFAFVGMATGEDASAAVATLHGSTIDGRILRVSLAHAPKSRFGGRVGGLTQTK